MNKKEPAEVLAAYIHDKLIAEAPKTENTLRNHLKLISEAAGNDGMGVNHDFQFNTVTVSDGDVGLFNPEVFRSVGVGKPPRPNNLLTSINISAANNSSYIDWVEEEARTGTVAPRAQNEASDSVTRTYKEYSAPMIMISADITITREQLADMDWLSGELIDSLTQDAREEMSDQVLNGPGTGSTMSGLFTNATPFAAGDFAGAVTGATERDVILCAINQAQLSNYNPNLIVVHPTDYTNMQFGWHESAVFNTTVFTSTQVPVGEYLVIDGTKVWLYVDDTTRAKFYEQHADNPIYSMVTAVLHSRAALKVYKKDYAGIIKGDLATDLAAITAP